MRAALRWRNRRLSILRGRSWQRRVPTAPLRFRAGTSEIEVSNPHFVTFKVPISGKAPVTVVLERPLETVMVSAYRSPLASADSPVSTRMLSPEQLRESASPALDGKLRQVPGFELFRRSSSLVANPTTEGVSLRGLGSTAASRSLVVLDDVPLNDPYGGWIHWEELPSLSIHSVEVVRGGASDLYGSSAIGGVIDVVPARPMPTSLQLTTSYGGRAHPTDTAALGTLKSGSVVGAGQRRRCRHRWLHSCCSRVCAARSISRTMCMRRRASRKSIVSLRARASRVLLRGNVLNETSPQRHALSGQQHPSLAIRSRAPTVSDFVLRFFGDNEHYRQTFSTIAPGRASETPTRVRIQTPPTELGAAAALAPCLWRPSA